MKKMERNQLAFFAGTVRKKSPNNSAIDQFGIQQRKPSAKPRNKISKNDKEDEQENGHEGAKRNWKKVFAFSKFMSLAKSQSTEGPAQLVIAGRQLQLFYL